MHPVGTIIELYHKLQFCLPLNSVFVGEMSIPQKIQTEGEERGRGVEDIRFTLDLHFHVFHLHLGRCCKFSRLRSGLKLFKIGEGKKN